MKSEAAQHIQHIRSITKISVSELSRIFGVSRQAVNDWINGKSLSIQNASKLSDLARAVNILSEEGVALHTGVFYRQIDGGPSIIDALIEGGDVIGLARVLSEKLVREKHQRELLASHFAGRPLDIVHTSAFGSPHLSET